MAPTLWVSVILVIVGEAISKKLGGILAMVGGILGFLYGIYRIIVINSFVALYSANEDVTITTGFGQYLTLIGFLIAFVGGIIQFTSFKEEEETPAPPPAQPPAPPPELETQ